MTFHQRKRSVAMAAAATYLLFVACIAIGPKRDLQNGWWDGLGPVLPHDTFPADCTLCHVGSKWQQVHDSFEFDHEAETGVPLNGAHAQAQCLRCHNDRGPVATFQQRGCVGCHEDIHFGQLGPNCTDCHQEQTWQPGGMIELHNRTRFPLVGIHAITACYRCHPGAEVGKFVPTDTECLTCHYEDFARANNPNHAALGWVRDCHRCHMPLDWNEAILNQ